MRACSAARSRADRSATWSPGTAWVAALLEVEVALGVRRPARSGPSRPPPSWRSSRRCADPSAYDVGDLARAAADSGSPVVPLVARDPPAGAGVGRGRRALRRHQPGHPGHRDGADRSPGGRGDQGRPRRLQRTPAPRSRPNTERTPVIGRSLMQVAVPDDLRAEGCGLDECTRRQPIAARVGGGRPARAVRRPGRHPGLGRLLRGGDSGARWPPTWGSDRPPWPGTPTGRRSSTWPVRSRSPRPRSPPRPSTSCCSRRARWARSARARPVAAARRRWPTNTTRSPRSRRAPAPSGCRAWSRPLIAGSAQEHERAAGAWHAEWETLSDLLRLVGSGAAWLADSVSQLQVHADVMRAPSRWSRWPTTGRTIPRRICGPRGGRCRPGG